MDKSCLKQEEECEWIMEPFGSMRVPAILFADEPLISAMDDKVFEQLHNIASLPGIVQAAYAMPDAHWGYGFPVGGVAAFDPNENGIVSAGGVGFDISCGVRTLLTGLKRKDLSSLKDRWAEVLYQAIPAGVGSAGSIHLKEDEMEKMLLGGAAWAVKQGYGEKEDLDYIEDKGVSMGAEPNQVSEKAKKRQQDEMGTLGSGNHYLEVQWVNEIFDTATARAYGIDIEDVVISIHCGSRGLGHQIGTDYLSEMVIAASQYNIHLVDRELACAPLNSELGKRYLGAMRAGINCALANRQMITHLVREATSKIFPEAKLKLLYDVSHNTCKEETHHINGTERRLFVHRKGATRAFGPHHPELPKAYQLYGQPVLIGGSMGTHSYILAGTEEGATLSFSSSCHGAGRALSRHQAAKKWNGKQVIEGLARKGIVIRSGSHRGIAEEAPGAYKDVTQVVLSAQKSGISRLVAELSPLICIKG